MAIPLVYAIPFNNLHLHRMKVAMDGLEHPTQSVYALSQARVGLLDGCGNHCDFAVLQLRWTTLESRELRSFYEEHHSEVLIYEYDSAEDFDNYLPGFYRWHPDLQLDSQSHSGKMERAYVVYLYDSWGPAGDWRCW
ncbi:MAG: hypothetical protein HN348_17685 [Proteobacteria bacterium]|nr:hypothetical protein [Pseudomonadota bacterium]